MKQYSFVEKQDKKVFDALIGEEDRERDGIELIPSENYVSRAVREANFSILTNKYSEGYPGKRYYGGQEYTDAVETLVKGTPYDVGMLLEHLADVRETANRIDAPRGKKAEAKGDEE